MWWWWWWWRLWVVEWLVAYTGHCSDGDWWLACLSVLSVEGGGRIVVEWRVAHFSLLCVAVTVWLLNSAPWGSAYWINSWATPSKLKPSTQSYQSFLHMTCEQKASVSVRYSVHFAGKMSLTSLSCSPWLRMATPLLWKCHGNFGTERVIYL